MSVSGDVPRKAPFFKKGGGWAGDASTSFMEPGFSHCSVGHDFFKHTGRKHFLLNVKIYSSQSWSGKHSWTQVEKSKIWASLCSSRGGGQNVPRVCFTKKEDDVGLTLPHPHWWGRGRCASRAFWETCSLQMEKSVWCVQPDLTGPG